MFKLGGSYYYKYAAESYRILELGRHLAMLQTTV